MLVKKKTENKQNQTLDKIKSYCNTLIVGLGNPGYNWTRHNIGSDILELIIKNYNYTPITKNLFLVFFNGWCSFVYLCPDIMNISGEKIKKIFDKLECENLIVLTDDLDTKIGNIKKSYGVSAGGHNGVKSIIEHFKHNLFWKIKIGIGRPEIQNEVTNYVLEKFNEEERDILLNQVKKCDNMLEEIWIFIMEQKEKKV